LLDHPAGNRKGFDTPVSFQDPEQARWFSEEVQPHDAMLRAWLHSRFPTESDIDDIVQETYLRALQAHAARSVSSVKAFVFATARNLAVDRVRRRNILRAEPLVDNEALSVLEESDGIPALVAHNQELELLTEAIQSLPDRCRQIFTLRKVYGLSQRKIAEQLGLSENTVSAQLTIGVKKCMEFMLRCRREREGRWP
jgi:RNA polymerase sigma factor (sigma-70 family)